MRTSETWIKATIPLRMRCCVQFCETNDTDVSESAGITFHEFPSEVHLRAAWLRALGKQNTLLPDSTVVCSQHFLHDDIYVTESGSRQICTGVIPSNVQVCRICLNTQSKLLLMSKYKLEKAYEYLVGQPLCDQRNLKQTFCIECAQQLMNFSRFRDKSLRAHSVMMDLVEKHKMITIQHIKSINRAKNQLTSDIVTTLLKPDHCDAYIIHSDEATETKLDATVEVAVIKQERDSMSVFECSQHHLVGINEETNIADIIEEHSYALKPEYLPIKMEKQLPDEPFKNKFSVTEQNMSKTQDQIKNESVFRCRLCIEEFDSEEEYEEHMNMHLGQWHECSVETDSENHAGHFPDLVKKDKQGKLYPTEEADKVETIAPLPMAFPKHNENKMHQSEKIDDLNILATGDLVKHVKTHTGKETLSCELCKYTCKRNSTLVKHMKTHTGVKHFACELCNYKSKSNNRFDSHMRTHTGQKAYACALCNYKTNSSSSLENHMRTHTGEKHFACELCNYKSKSNNRFDSHMRTHTGQKAYACGLCNYKTNSSSSLENHMRTHTGEKPYVCAVCNHKFTENSNLVKHMKMHTGVKPFICDICNRKFSVKCNLVNHMRIHTGDKPFACELCNYKCREKSSLVSHMSTHTGIKPYICKVCNHKCARKYRLMTHMRTHTGDKPFACELCKHKFVQNSDLVKHMRTNAHLKSVKQIKSISKTVTESHINVLDTDGV